MVFVSAFSVPPVCTTDVCENGGDCIPQGADYSCKCADGFKGKNCQGEVCVGGYGIFVLGFTPPRTSLVDDCSGVDISAAP